MKREKMTDIKIPNCDHCGKELAEKITKNGRNVWACPRWEPGGRGCQGTIYDPERPEQHKRIYPKVMIRWNIPSKSEPGKVRTVEIYESGDTRCNCFAGGTQKFCRHQQATLMHLIKLVELIQEQNKFQVWQFKNKSVQ